MDGNSTHPLKSTRNIFIVLKFDPRYCQFFEKEERDGRLQKVEIEAEGIRKTANKLKEEKERIKSLIDSLGDEVQEIERMTSTLNGVLDLTDAKTMNGIVHKHIKAVRLQRFDFEKKYRRNGTPQKPNGIKITVELFDGKSVVFAYLPYVRRKDNDYRLVDENVCCGVLSASEGNATKHTLH